MSYQIRKGWPSAGAIDESFEPATATAEFAKTLKGFVVDLASTGKVGLASYTGGTKTTGIPFFCYDYGTIPAQALCIKSPCVIECDADHYESGTYNVGGKVTALAGKFKPWTDGDGEVGTILAFDNGTLRVLWTALS